MKVKALKTMKATKIPLTKISTRGTLSAKLLIGDFEICLI
jgi:hypothetical protein